MTSFVRGRTSDLLAVNVEIDERQFRREQRELLGNDLPFATALALTNLVKDMQVETGREIGPSFHNPTRFTRNATFIEPAKKRDYPNLTAAVYFKDEAPKGVPAGRYLHPNVVGRSREHKGFEKALIRAGVMQRQEYAVPGKKLKLNAAGNVSVGLIRQMLSQLKAGNVEQFETRASREAKRGKTGRLRGKRFFVASDNSVLPRGIYQRTGRKEPQLVFLFVRDKPDYSRRLPFRSIQEDVSRRRSRRVFDLDFEQVVAGNRKRRTGIGKRG
jgi:hypothetical protein